MKIQFQILVLLLPILILPGCAQKKDGNADKGENQTNELKYARQLKMYEQDGNTVAEIRLPGDSVKVWKRYIMVPKGGKEPAADKETTVIHTPLKSAVVYTSVHAAAIDELGRAGIIKGVIDAGFFRLPYVVEGLKNKTIADIGPIASPSTEKGMDLSPDVIIANQYDGVDFKGIDRLGIPMVYMAENFEETPLGRAEWIKFIGALIGERAKADSIFNVTASNYNRLKEKSAKNQHRPKVMFDNMYQGVWYMAGGGSYQARMIADAGGNYAFADDKSAGSLSLTFEQVLDKCADSDIWILKLFGTSDLDKAGLMKMDSRYTHFAPVEKGGVFFCDTSASNIFDETPFHPDLLLQDYAGIFSGDFSSLRYYKQMKP